jgi:arylsulfatase A-like enzyme
MSLRAALLEGAVWGSVSALGQVLKVYRRHYIQGEFAWASRDVFWMTPIANVFYFCVAALVLWLVTRAVRGRVSPPFMSGVLAGLSVFGVLVPFGGIHLAAVFALSLGVGLQVGRMVRAGFPRLQRVVQVGALTAAVVLVIGGLVERQGRERRAAPVEASRPPEGAPNVLLLIWDTVRAANLSHYGYERETTPELTRIAASSTTFDWAFSPAPWTLPSHCSMFTGLLASQHGCGWLDPLDDDPPTLAELFARRGYRTGGFVANKFYATHETRLQRGFVTYQDFPVSVQQLLLSSSFAQLAIARDLVMGRGFAGKTKSLRELELRGDAKPLIQRKTAEMVNADFLEWLQRGDGPFFAFLNYFDAHDPYDPPGAFRTRFGAAPDPMALYDGGIAYIDHQVGRLLRELQNRQLLDNTIVVITSDHGELFGEHGLYAHGNALYMPLLHVPLVIRYPARVAQGTRVSRSTALHNIARTITELAGLTDTLPGINLVDSAWQAAPDSGTPAFDRVVLAETGRMQRFVGRGPAGRGVMNTLIDDRYHFIRNPTGDKDELFAYRTDRAEAHNLAVTAEGAGIAAKYRALLSAIKGRLED